MIARRNRDFSVSSPTRKLPFRLRVQREPQKIDRFRTFTATLARVFLRKATKFNELGLLRFQGQAKLPQSLAQYILDANSVLTILETQHKVVNVSHQIGLTSQPRLDHALEPQIEHVVQIHITQQNAD